LDGTRDLDLDLDGMGVGVRVRVRVGTIGVRVRVRVGMIGVRVRVGVGVRVRETGGTNLDLVGVLVRDGAGVLVRDGAGVRVLDGARDLEGLADGHRKGPVLPGPTKRVHFPRIGPETVPAKQRFVSRHQPQKGSATHVKQVLELTHSFMRQVP